MGNVDAKSLKKHMKLSCVSNGDATITLCKSSQIIVWPDSSLREDRESGLKG